METSEVATRSTPVRYFSKTWKTEERNPYAMSMRGAVMVMPVMPFLMAIAAQGALGTPGGGNSGAGNFRFQGVQDADRDIGFHGRLDGARMENLGTEIGQLRRFGKADLPQ